MPSPLAPRRWWSRAFASSVLVGMCLANHAVSAQYRIDHWTTDDGLPQNSVLALLQTRDGYLWAATPDGLVRFDGRTFTIYSKATTPGLTTNRFSALFQSADGSMWIGTEDRGVVRYRDGVFETFGPESGPAHPVWSIRARADGQVVVFTQTGPSVFDGTRFQSAGPQGHHPAKGRWAPGTRLEPAGLVRFDGHDTARHTYPPGVLLAGVSLVTEDNAGRIWLVTRDGTYFRLHDDVWTREPQNHRLVPEPRAIYADTGGRLWRPTASGLLVSEPDGRSQVVELLPTPPGDGFYTMLEDREGSLWLGAIRSGLFRIRRQVVDVIAREEGLADDNVYPLVEDASGRVWMGTWGGGLHRLSPDGLTRWTARDGMPGDQISALYADDDGTMIVGVMHQGIVVIGNDGEIRSRLKPQPGARVVSAIARDGDGTLWLGTNGGLVAVKGDAVERTLTVADGLPDDRIRALTRDREGRLWIGTLSGVARLAAGMVTSPPGSNVLAGDHVRAIHEDDEGTVWVGTADAGLVRIRDGVATRYTTATGLASDGVFAIVDDGAGHFWTSSNRGLAQVERRQLTDFAAGRIPFVTARAFTRADGLRTLEANGGKQPAGFRAHDGRLWFATARGAAIVNPARIPPAVAPPAPVVEQAAAGGRTLVRPTTLELEPGQAFLSVAYGVGLLSSPETVRFRVRLIGLDDAWTDVGSQRTMTYSALRPGTYRFEVAAVNGGRVGAAATLPIHIRPRFYETVWFTVLTLAVAGGSVLLVVQKRRARHRLSQRQEREFARRLLESQDRERERLAAEVHDGLGQHLLVIRNQALLGTETTTADCLLSIAETAAHALDEVRTIAAALHPATLERLGLIRALSALVRALSQSSAVPVTFDAPERRRLPASIELQLYRIVQESLSNALRHADASAVSVTVAFTDEDMEITVRDDGRGFDPAAVVLRGDGALGLSSIRERARSIEADLSVVSASGRGTMISVRLRLSRVEEPIEVERV